MNPSELKDFLNQKAEEYNHPDFIELDPIQIPHRFSQTQDIEIAGFLAATISWGNRKSIVRSANKMMNLMGNSPFDFVTNFSEKEINDIQKLTIHRTFNGEDFAYFLKQFRRIYSENKSLETLFLLKDNETNFYHALERFRNYFLETQKHRSHKHVSSTYKNSSSKRLMMFLRWMVRQDRKGVDLGIWKNINQKYLSIPLDVHTGNTSRNLQLISRQQNDWKTVEELDLVIRKFDSEDPAKYDFALFGVGINNEI